MTCVLLVSDVRINREALASQIARDGRVGVAAHAACAEAIQTADTAADVVVVDTSLHNGCEVARGVVNWAKAPIVALAVPEDDAQVIDLAEMGVIGFLERDANLDELVAGIANAARNQATVPPRVATALLHHVSSRANSQQGDPSILTVRELQVVDLIAESLSNKEIAGQLGIEVATVKNHVHNILEKLEVSRRSEVVARLRSVRSGRERSAESQLAIAGSTTSD